MSARPVAPVIPSASPGRPPGKPGAGRPMPLASPPGRPDVVYGFGRIDASGRVADRATIKAYSATTFTAMITSDQHGWAPMKNI